MKFEFPHKAGSGFAKLLPHVSQSCLSLLEGLLHYDPELRFSARQALRHPYLKDLRDVDKRIHAAAVAAKLGTPPTSMTSKTHKQIFKPTRLTDAHGGSSNRGSRSSLVAGGRSTTFISGNTGETKPLPTEGKAAAVPPKPAPPVANRLLPVPSYAHNKHEQLVADVTDSVKLTPCQPSLRPQQRTRIPAKQNRRYANITSKINSGIHTLPALNGTAKPTLALSPGKRKERRLPNMGALSLPRIT